jgi:hypothetical protein
MQARTRNPIGTIWRGSHITVVPLGFLSHGRYFLILAACVEPRSQQARLLHGRALTRAIGEFDMSRAINFFTSTSAFTSPSEKVASTLDPIALFGGICFFALVIAMLTGEQGIWL